MWDAGAYPRNAKDRNVGKRKANPDTAPLTTKIGIPDVKSHTNYTYLILLFLIFLTISGTGMGQKRSRQEKKLSAGSMVAPLELGSRYGQANLGSTNPTYIDKPDTVAIGQNRGEILPFYTLDPIEVRARELSAEEKRNYLRLVYNVRKTYPYAVMAKERMDQYNAMRASMEKKKDQRKFLKAEEEKIKADFMEDLKNMTKSQGAVLIRLLARQTDTTAYFLLKDFRGGAKAFAYQTMAVFWGYNLKEGYQPEGRDRDIEAIVRLIEAGRLSTIPPQKAPALDNKSQKGKNTKRNNLPDHKPRRKR